ncbi:MAG TPA: sigma-70 family RNA polymerase sigma factor [Gemmatimonadales bacterium]|nr:sigma-70 family RNA polymerase sigma factor [Gemmatimonadales bacterium]
MSINDINLPSDSAPSPAAAPSPHRSESELAHRFWDRIRLFALRRLRDPSAAEDVAQEVLRRVLEALRADRLRSHAALPGFVFQTAHHVVLQQYRGSGREVRALQRLHTASERETGTDVLSSLISEERRVAVRAALARMEPDDRDLLAWFYQEHTDPAEIARRLAVTPGALRVRKHRALKRLADLLGGAAGNDP